MTSACHTLTELVQVTVLFSDIRNKIELETPLENLKDQLKKSIKSRACLDGDSEEAAMLGHAAGKARRKPLENGTKSQKPRQAEKMRFSFDS